MINKKAQGLSVSMIILIVLGLIIVGVLVFMLGGKVRDFGKSTNSCVEKKGTCVEAASCNGAIVGSLNCPTERPELENPVCCVSYAEQPSVNEDTT